LSHIEAFNLQIDKADGAIKEKACEDKDICLLMSLPGVDVRTALFPMKKPFCPNH